MLSVEAKVGAMGLAGLLALALVFFTLNNFEFGQKGYEIQVVFQRVEGLRVGAPVRVAGVDVGKVSDLNLTKEGVVVHLRLGEEVRIPHGSDFLIRTAGLMGDKFVEVTPNYESSAYLEPGRKVAGQEVVNMEEVAAHVGTTFEKVEKMVDSLNEIVGKEEVKKSAQDSIVNLAKLTENLNNLTLLLNQMALDNRSNIRDALRNLRAMSENMEATSREVKVLAEGMEANGATAKKVQEILDNLNYSSKKATQIADDIHSLTGDQDLKRDIKVAVKEARNTVEKTNKLLTDLQGTTTSFSYEAQYTSHEKGRLENSVNMQINPNDKQFYILGLTNQEDKNRANLQLGTKINPSTSFKAGLFKDYMGLALTKDFNKKFSLEGQITNQDDFHFNLKSHYHFKPDLALTIQADNLLSNGEKETHFGLQQKF